MLKASIYWLLYEHCLIKNSGLPQNVAALFLFLHTRKLKLSWLVKNKNLKQNRFTVIPMALQVNLQDSKICHLLWKKFRQERSKHPLFLYYLSADLRCASAVPASTCVTIRTLNSSVVLRDEYQQSENRSKVSADWLSNFPLLCQLWSWRVNIQTQVHADVWALKNEEHHASKMALYVKACAV